MTGSKSRQRVVSLVPSVTETLLAWGVTPVGVTRFCEAPGVVTVGGTKNPDVRAIASLAPDLVVMDKEENRLEDAEALRELGLRVHVTHVRGLADVAPTLADLAAAIGRPPPQTSEPSPAPELTARGASVSGDLPRAWVPIWRRPWMSIGAATYASSLLTAAGIANVCADAAEPYPRLTLDETAALRPDVILAPSEPYPFKERHRAELESVAPVLFVDGQDLFWWGSRTPGALSRLEQLAARLVSGKHRRHTAPRGGDWT